jgi:hypothetical protein
VLPGVGVRRGCVLAVLVAALVPAVGRAAGTAAPTQPAAPFGLRFGMQPADVSLPVVVAPAPLGQEDRTRAAHPRAAPPSPRPPRAQRSSGPPLPLFAAGDAPATPRPARPAGAALPSAASGTPVAARPSDRAQAYLGACEAAFDRISDLGAAAPEWLAWRVAHLTGNEGTDLAATLAGYGVAARRGAPAQGLRALAAQRSAGLYRVDSADGRRVVCLLFTVDGLAQVFVAGVSLNGIRDEIIARLDAREDLADFALVRKNERFSLSLSRPVCGVYCRVFGERMLIERRMWLDGTQRVLVAAKRGVTVSGLGGLFAGGASDRDLADGLPDSFVSSIDLTRRARVVRAVFSTSAGADASAAGGPTFAAASAGTAAIPPGVSHRAVIESFLP